MRDNEYISHSVNIRNAENGCVVKVTDSSNGNYDTRTFVGSTREEALSRAGESNCGTETRALRQPLAGAMARTIFSDIGKK